MCQRAGEQGPPFPTPLLEVSPVLLACLHLQTLSSPPRKPSSSCISREAWSQAQLRVPCLGLHLPCSDSVLGQLPHPGVLLSLVAQASPRLCPPCVGQLCWLPRLQFIQRKGKARPAARCQGSGVGVQSGALRSGNSFRTLAGSGHPGKPEQRDWHRPRLPAERVALKTSGWPLGGPKGGFLESLQSWLPSAGL